MKRIEDGENIRFAQARAKMEKMNVWLGGMAAALNFDHVKAKAIMISKTRGRYPLTRESFPGQIRHDLEYEQDRSTG